MAFSDEFLYQLTEANPIEDVMKSYVQLIRKGNKLVCSCPFHSEKTPSCTVYPDTQSFYCFGCGAGGDVITFVKRIENLGYVETIKLLAERAGMTMPDNSVNEDAAKQKMRILQINRETANFFFKSLISDSSKTGMKYFMERGLSPQTIKKYGLGFAPDSWNDLHNHLRSKGFDDKDIIASGVCLSKNSSIYSSFRNRVMFPIVDLRGNVIAFGGRVLDDSKPKYINTGDTPVYKKSRNLFSLNFAKNSPSTRLILAEGYMDVISINQAGFENVVATCGTALTPEQARLMATYAKEVIISYDSDAAGQTATQKAINLLSDAGITTKIIKMQGAKDPDEFIKKFGADRFRLLLENSDGAINFELEKCKYGLDLMTETGRVDMLKRAVRVLSQISNPLERDVYISKIAKEAEININVLKIQVDGEIKNRIKNKKSDEWKNIVNKPILTDKLNPEQKKYPRESKAEEDIITYIIKHPDCAEKIHSLINEEQFVTSFNKKVYSAVYEKIISVQNFTFSLLSDILSIDEMGKLTGIVAKYKDILLTDETIDDCIRILLDFSSGISSDSVEVNSDEDLLQLAEKLRNKK